ncbi:MAG: heparinase II/III family protein, partial [Pseudomonadota bacterium]
GYARIHGGPLHHRHWRLDADSLTITDRLDGPFETAIARYRLHPDVEADGSSLLLQKPVAIRVDGAEMRWVPSDWAPEFGAIVPTQTLELHMTAPECSLTLSWAGASAAPPETDETL